MVLVELVSSLSLKGLLVRMAVQLRSLVQAMCCISFFAQCPEFCKVSFEGFAAG